MKYHLRWAALAVLIVAVAALVWAMTGSFESVSLALQPDGFHTYLAEGAAGLAALEKQMQEVAGELKKAADDVKKKGEALTTEMKNLGEASKETKSQVDEALVKHNGLAEQHGDLVKKHSETVARLVQVEQTLAKRTEEQDPPKLKTLGEMFVENAQVKAFNSSTRGSVRVQMSRKDILNVTGTVGTSPSQANSLVTAMRVPGIAMPPERKLTIRDLLAPGETSQGMVEFAQETGFTNNARVVTEGDSKPQSEITFELKHAPVRTIAHIFKASRQILDDAPALRSYIDARARYGVRLEEEDELLNGDGTGAHILGLVSQAATYNSSLAAGAIEAAQKMDVIRLAILQVFLAEFPASGIVLNPIDWAVIQLTKDSQERYIIGNPQDGNTPRLWGLPVVETQSMDATEFLVGAFNMAAQLFDRMEIEVLMSTENSTDFEKNLVTLRAEERLALCVYRPEAFVSGDFDTATA